MPRWNHEVLAPLKKCSSCGGIKGLSSFYFYRNMPRQPCIECWCARVVKRGVEKPEVARGWNLKRLYGIGVAEYEAMFTSQGGVCAICGNPPSGNGSRQVHLHVDHDHSSGKIRQLLCHKCNMGLGAFGDDVDLLRAAVEYLIKWGD